VIRRRLRRSAERFAASSGAPFLQPFTFLLEEVTRIAPILPPARAERIGPNINPCSILTRRAREKSPHISATARLLR
jgi:hypothetical protein